MARVSRRRNRDEDVPRSSRYVDDVDDEELEDDDEDAEEERPRRSRRGGSSRGSSRPAGRRGRDEDADDEDEEERPRRSRRQRDADDEEEERPRRQASRSRRQSDEEVEEERPRRSADRGRRGSSSSSRRSVESGWGGVDKVKSQGGFAENLKVPKDDEIIIKILDDQPFASYREHWVQETKASRKTYTCLGAEECPLCVTLGHQTSAKIMFNVADMSSSDPTVKVWSMGTRLAEKLKTLAQKPRTKPLNREDLYWAVSKSGKGTSTEYNLEPVKADDLDDWGIEPLEDDELDDLMEQRSDQSIIKWDSVEDLEELVEEIL